MMSVPLVRCAATTPSSRHEDRRKLVGDLGELRGYMVNIWDTSFVYALCMVCKVDNYIGDSWDRYIYIYICICLGELYRSHYITIDDG